MAPYTCRALIFHDWKPRYRPGPLRGQGGVPWGKIMENEFECLTDGRGLGGYFSEEFVPKESYSRPD